MVQEGGEGYYDGGYHDKYHMSSNHRGRYRGRGQGRGRGRGSYSSNYNYRGGYNGYNSYRGGYRGGYGGNGSIEGTTNGHYTSNSNNGPLANGGYDEAEFSGENYRGSHRGRGRGRGGGYSPQSHKFYNNGNHDGSKSKTMVKDDENKRKIQDFNNPWINSLQIESESDQQTLEARYDELSQINQHLINLQKKKITLNSNLINLERLAIKEELNVQISNEKLEEITLL